MTCSFFRLNWFTCNEIIFETERFYSEEHEKVFRELISVFLLALS